MDPAETRKALTREEIEARSHQARAYYTWTPANKPPENAEEILMTDGSEYFVGRFIRIDGVGYAVKVHGTYVPCPGICLWATVPDLPLGGLPEGCTEEQMCLYFIELSRTRYEQESKPWFERLAALRMREPTHYWITRDP